MKKIITICAAILMTASLWAQSPEKMSYQAVVRDGSNNLVSSTAVGMQISILQGSASGTAVYIETQTPTSNTNGLVSLEIGTGTLVSGDFTTIDWVNGPYFVKTETDPTGGSAYTITGTSQLLSVPYALYAKNTASWQTNVDTTYTHNRVGIGTTSPKERLQLGDKMFIHAEPVVQAIMFNQFWNGGNWEYATDNPASGIEFNSSNSGAVAIWTAEPGLSGNQVALQCRIMILNNGNVGINTNTPARSLHVSDVMRIEPRSTAPASPAEGDIYMDNIAHKLMVYDGTTWQACW